MTQPRFLDDVVAQRIVGAVRAGASRIAAAEAARVGRTTLFRWLKMGSEGIEPYTAFAAKVREAEGALETELVGVVKGHSANSWQAAAWLLERKWQKRWAIRRVPEAKTDAARTGVTFSSVEAQLSTIESLRAAVLSARDDTSHPAPAAIFLERK